VRAWIELTGTSMDGKVLAVPDNLEPLMAYRHTTADPVDARVDEVEIPATGPVRFEPVEMVATGSVRWSGDEAFEVYVPADRLELWRAEHDVDGT